MTNVATILTREGKEGIENSERFSEFSLLRLTDPSAAITIAIIESEKANMLTALYDGNCLICQSTCETMRALDWLRRIEFVDLHQAEVENERFAKLNPQRLMSEIHVLDADGRLYAGFAGMRRMLREVPLGLPLWLLLKMPGSDALGKRVYRSVARRRYRINALLGNETPACADESCEMLR